MDHLSEVNFASDSTILLALEAKRRGYKLFYYHPSKLSLHNGQVVARGQALQVFDKAEKFYALGEEELLNLSEADIILIRQDPPFDMSYITATYFLEMLPPSVKIVNNPTYIRNSPEKIFVCNYPQLMTATLISRDQRKIEEFRKIHQNIIIKPLYGHGGNDVFYIAENDPNFTTITEIFQKFYNQHFIIQKFIPEVRLEGDKRIIMVDGTAIAAISRVPQQDSIKSNLIAGGQGYKTELSARDLEICQTIGPELKRRGILLAGVDIIGGFITEINVTSPTGLRTVNRLYDMAIERIVWDCILKLL
jgi:glutathione synthase